MPAGSKATVFALTWTGANSTDPLLAELARARAPAIETSRTRRTISAEQIATAAAGILKRIDIFSLDGAFSSDSKCLSGIGYPLGAIAYVRTNGRPDGSTGINRTLTMLVTIEEHRQASSRTAGAGKVRLPDFLVIGAAKSGTTSLHGYLSRHSGVFMATPKEPQYFSDDEINAKGLDWYGSLFEGAGENQLAGEASTTYTRWPHTADAAGRIAETLPSAKLIYIVRHPVDRAYSHYAHHMRLGVTMTFEEALENSSVYVDCSLYMDQLNRYRAHFDDDQILVLRLNDIRQEASQTLEAILAFLDLPDEDLASESLVANRTGAHHLIRSRTTARIRRIPGAEALLGAMPKGLRSRGSGLIERSPVGRRIGKEFDLRPMEAATREQLLERFKEANAELGAYLGRDLSDWNA